MGSAQGLEGVLTLVCDDAAWLQAALAAKPRRALILGAGFIGNVIGAIAAEMRRDAGVDLPTGVGVTKLEGDAKGHVRYAHPRRREWEKIERPAGH